MTYEEVNYILNFSNLALHTKIGSKSTTEGGTEHPLWTLLNAAFPPAVAWKSLRPCIRTQVVNAGKYLHKNNIPYGYYTNYLKRFKKGYLKRTPLILLTYKQKPNTNTQNLLNEFITCFKLAEDCFKQDPTILQINDKIYEQFPTAFDSGHLSYIHSLILIRNTLKATHTAEDIYIILSHSNSPHEFWNILGKTVIENKPLQINLSEGTTNQKDITILKNEMLIRTQKNQGKPNPIFNKYFKTNGTLSAMGIKVVSGEQVL